MTSYSSLFAYLLFSSVINIPFVILLFLKFFLKQLALQLLLTKRNGTPFAVAPKARTVSP